MLRELVLRIAHPKQHLSTMLKGVRRLQRALTKDLALRWHGYFPIALVGLVGVVITGLVFREVTNWERQRNQNAFQEATRDRILVIQREIQHTLGLVQDIGSFIDASHLIERGEFREFVNPALKRHGSIQALQWVPRVSAIERDRFESEARHSFPKFRITERDEQGDFVTATLRDEHYPILYVQPYQHNREALGFDLASDPLELKALLAAADAGRTHVSPPVPIYRNGVLRTGFVARLPVYHKDSSVDQEESEFEDEAADAAAREHQELRGIAVGIFRIGDVVEQALASLTPSGIEMRIYEVLGEDEKRLLYYHASRMRAGPLPSLPEENDTSPTGVWQFTGTLEVANQQWAVVSNPITGYFQPDPWSGWVILLGGLAFTSLLTVYLTTLIGQAEKVKHLVEERTEQLVETNRALVNEITGRRRVERELHMLNETLEQRVIRRTTEAERRAKELEQFAYVASHDLKAPLRGISNLASWLQEDLAANLTDDSSDHLTLLRDRVQRMQALIDGLLEYSRVGAMEGSKETVVTLQLLAEIIDSLSPPKGFSIDVDPNMPTLYTDRLLLTQVFANLISNSIKHHGGRKGHVWIAVRDDGRYYEFSVADDGPGIAPEYHDKVFMMFQTLTIKDFGSDTGIGLALVKKIVLEQGGLITLDSKEGEGCVFRFTWPKQT